ncbi:MAG: hypothetical protein KJO12_03650 [Ignavibacteria bacterium]|nr:hypothetical protein [Ignavibacteria bacterium]
MKFLFTVALILFYSLICFSQDKLESDIDLAYKNAMKGIYWALLNIPEKKSKLESDLIADDKLYAEIKLYKEVNGIKIEAIGFYHSNEVRIKIYKSFDSLEKDGYIKKKDEEE